MVRFVQGMDFRDHVGSQELLKLSWLSIPDRITYFRMIHLFKICNKTAPSYLLSRFTFVSQTHSHNTRGSEHNFQLSHDLALAQNSFSFLASKEWNALPPELKALKDLRVFKKRLKSHLFSHYDWSITIWARLSHCIYLWFYDFNFLIFVTFNSCCNGDSIGKKS